MDNIGSYAVPLLAALAYTFSTLFLKRALSFGAGTMRIVFITNFIIVLFFLPLLIWNHSVHNWDLFGMLLLCAFFNTLAMVLNFITIKLGDISVQTPVMGTKVLMVALLSLFMGVGIVTQELWIACIVSVIAVYILSKEERLETKNNKSLTITIIFSMLTALAFAIADVLMAKYSVYFGEGPFLVYTVALTALFSVVLIPFFEGKLKDIPRISWPWVMWGAFFMGLEAILYCGALAFYNNPTSINILYSSRGIWSVVLVWFLGGFFGNTENEKGRSIMFRRLIGSCLLFISIILVIVSKS